jgi:hypothetical protein
MEKAIRPKGAAGWVVARKKDLERISLPPFQGGFVMLIYPGVKTPGCVL